MSDDRGLLVAPRAFNIARKYSFNINTSLRSNNFEQILKISGGEKNNYETRRTECE